MRSLVAFLLGIAVTIGAAYVHDTAYAGSTDKPLVNWTEFSDITHNVVDGIRAQWNRLTNR
jgi:hypothetical protein